jgi:hypothetical protein
MYKYGTLKPVEVILRRGGGRGRIMEGMNQIKIVCMHKWKYNESTCETIIP